MLCHHCANEPHRSWIPNTLVLRPMSPAFHMVHNNYEQCWRIWSNIFGIPFIALVQVWDTLLQRFLYRYTGRLCVSGYRVEKTWARTDSTHFSLPKSICSLSSSSPFPPIYYNCYCNSVPLQSTLYFLAAGLWKPAQPICSVSSQPPLAFSLRCWWKGEGEGCKNLHCICHLSSKTGGGVKFAFVTCRRTPSTWTQPLCAPAALAIRDRPR